MLKGRLGGHMAALGQTTMAVSTYFVLTPVLKTTSPWLVVTLRLLCASALLSVILYRRRATLVAMPAQYRWRLVLLGFLGVTFNNSAFTVGLSLSTPGHSALLYAMTPLVIVVIALLRRVEQLSVKRLLGIGCALAGVFLLLHQRPLAGPVQGEFVILSGVCAWALYSVLGKSVLEHYDPLLVTAASTVIGTLLFLPIGIPVMMMTDFSLIPASTFASIAYLAVASSILAYVFWYTAIARLGPGRVAVYMNLQPVSVALTSIALGWDVLTWNTFGGGLLVLAGVLLAAVLR